MLLGNDFEHNLSWLNPKWIIVIIDSMKIWEYIFYQNWMYLIKSKTDYNNYYLVDMYFKILQAFSTYSRVHKSLPPFFSKILEKPSKVQKKMIPHINGLGFSLIWSKKKSKWPT